MLLQAEINVGLGDFQKNLLNVIRAHINAAMNDAILDIQVAIGDLFEEKVKKSAEYKSMVGGVLRGDLGLDDPEVYLSDIIDTIKTNISVKYKPIPKITNTITSGGISIWLIRSNYKDVLSLPDSKFVSSGGYLIEWLKWMLTKGDDVLVKEYFVAHGDYPNSRSGHALMFEKAGGVYRIPSQFSGLPGNNFLTRAIKNADKDIVAILEKSIKRYL